MNFDKSSTVLHWNYRGFTKFPLEHLQGEEAEVTDIYLKENLISHVPNSIGKLRNLESLYLSGNDITELPSEISMLRCLKCLDVSGNRLRHIPDEIGEVRTLKFLILDENELSSLPLRIAELRALRYLSVCDNKLQWLPQRPVYNYYHCEFRFWRNPELKTIPYLLWYHMFREQQTRSLNIGCLYMKGAQNTTHYNKCRLIIHHDSRECEIDINCPPQYTNIIEPEIKSPPSLLELTKRIAYQMISTTVNLFTTHLSIYSEESGIFQEKFSKEDKKPTTSIDKTLNEFEIDADDVTSCDLNGTNVDKILNWTDNTLRSHTKKRKAYYVARDIIEEFFAFIPHVIKTELCNGPISKCDNAYCKKPIFDYVHYEFCIEKIILIDSTEDVILNATFCSRSCADTWKSGKQNLMQWKLLK